MESSSPNLTSKDVIALLVQKFPACFSDKGDAKPLKIGVFQDLAKELEDEEGLSKTLLRSALRRYTGSWRYLYSVKEGAARVDLQGNEVEKVDKDHALHASEQLKESKEKAAEARKAAPQNKKANDTNADPKKKNKPKKKGTKGTKSSSNKGAVAQKLQADDMKVGTAVTVKLGKIPMPAVITECEKDDIRVQLESGMTVKVDVDMLRLAPKKR